jgi:hypothetical protein
MLTNKAAIQQLLLDRDERDSLRFKLALIRTKLQEIVCVVPPDDGVVLLSQDGPCREPTAEERARGWTGQVYVHEHFSPLGDALMELWELAQESVLGTPGYTQEKPNDSIRTVPCDGEGTGDGRVTT